MGVLDARVHKTNRLWQYAAATDAFSDADSMRKEATLCTCQALMLFTRLAAVVANMNSVVPWAVLLLLHVLWLRFG